MLCIRFLLLILAVPAGLYGQDQQDLQLSPTPGFHDKAVRVFLGDGAAGEIRYTLDGSQPTERSPRYQGDPLLLERSGVVCATRFQDGKATTHVAGTYLIGEPATDLLTVCLGIDPWRLFSHRYGWFEAGPDPERPNWDTHREHPVHIDIFETNGQRVHAGTMGFRVFGGASRSHPQKSFSLSGRKAYGNKRVNYPLFGPDGEKDFRFLVLRNGGSDWGRSFIRDPLMTGLLQDRSWTLDRQAARPAQVYINGQYWGVYHLREKINPRFLEDHHAGVDKDYLSLLEHENSVKHGDGTAYTELREFIRSADLSQPDAYDRLQNMMDVDNFQQLQIAQTYFDNHDAGGNIRYWRPNGPGGRFRWILYDVDQGFGLHRTDGWTRNTLELYTAADGPAWPNPPWSTLFQRKLLANSTYRRNFVNRTLDYLHTDFSPEAVTDRIDQVVEALARDMPRQLVRWDLQRKNWDRQIDQLRRFALYRPAHLREHYRTYFDGGADRSVQLAASVGGFVVLNDNLQVGADGLRGTYFANYPLALRAVAEPGYQFVGWEGVTNTSDSLLLDLREDKVYQLVARFEPLRHPAAAFVIVNEICPKNDGSGDWLELYNRGEAAIDLTGWYLIDDSEQRFVFPRTVLPREGYLVVCRDGEEFRKVYPHVYDLLDGLPFGLNKEGDRIGLYAADNGYVNAVSYQFEPSADTAFTYALALPGLDNTRHRHWVREAGPGTPGTANPDHLQSVIMTRQRFWVRIGIGVAVLLVVGVARTWHDRR